MIAASLTLLAMTVCLMSGCGFPYLVHVTKGQLQLMHQRQNIREELEEGTVSFEQKKKLQLVLEVRRYALETLKLEGEQNYIKYVHLERDSVAYNLVVCPKDRLEPYRWWFPFVGSVEYLGFFDKDYALENKKEYEEEGYDVYARGASAYSTLGWFSDPVFSTMLKFSDATLSNIIIHELTHATIYRKGETSYNEGVATFIGNRGSKDFLIQKYGANSKEYVEAKNSEEDDFLFSQFMKGARKDLEAFYQKPLTKEDKIQGREKIFLKIKSDFLALKPKFKTNAYAYFDKLTLNNAVIIAFGQYYQDLSRFEKIWEENGKSLPRTIEFLSKIKDG